MSEVGYGATQSREIDALINKTDQTIVTAFYIKTCPSIVKAMYTKKIKVVSGKLCLLDKYTEID